MLRLDLLDLGVEQTISRLRLPRPDGAVGEEQFDLLDRLAGRLGIRQEGLDGGAEAEHAEDDEELPADVLKGGRDEEADCEVEEPVGDGRERHARGARLERPHLGRVHPGDGRQGDGVGQHEEVAEGDDGVGGRALDLHLDAQVAVEPVRQRRAVRA